MKFKKQIAVLAAGIIMMTTFVGCGGSSDSGSSSNGATTSTTTNNSTNSETSSGDVVLAQDQTIKLLFTSPQTIDTSDARNANEFEIMTHIHETLLREFVDENGNQYSELAGAESYDVSDDGLVHTFSLRDNTWSDGVPVTATHYADAFIRILDAKEAFSYAFFAFEIKNAELYYNQQSALLAQEAGTELTEAQQGYLALDLVTIEDIGVKAVDDKTLEITLEKQSPVFSKKLSFITFAPIRLDVLETMTDGWETDHTQHVYSGPFVIDTWVSENSMSLVKNENYWDKENIIIEKVEYVTAEEVSTQAQLFESKSLDVVQGNTSDYIQRWGSMAEKGEFDYIKAYYPSNGYLTANQKTGGPSGLMQNQKVRLALSLSIDREELTEFVYGRYSPAYGVVPNGVSVGSKSYRDSVTEPLLDTFNEYARDPEALQAMFKEGMAEAGVSGELSDVNLVYITTASDALSKSVQEYIQQTFKTILGINIELKVLERSTFVEERNAHKYDMTQMGWHGDYNDPLTFIDMWITEGGYSQFMGWYSSDDYDAMLIELDGITDEAQRMSKYAELEEQLILTDAGIMPLYYGDQNYFVQSNVENVSFPSFGSSIEFSRAYIIE